MKRVLFFSTILLACTAGLTAEETKVVRTGDPQAGLEYAKKVCANCHSITNDKSPEVQATTFREIADVPGMSSAALLVWMQTQHPTMPDIALEGEDLMDVIAYILSFKIRDDDSETEVTKSDSIQTTIDNPEAIAMLGDPKAGLAYAKDVCSSCHGIADEKSPQPEATAFSKVANVEAMSAKSLLVWIRVLHPSMPNITLEREDLLNVIAYILSQKSTN